MDLRGRRARNGATEQFAEKLVLVREAHLGRYIFNDLTARRKVVPFPNRARSEFFSHSVKPRPSKEPFMKCAQVRLWTRGRSN